MAWLDAAAANWYALDLATRRRPTGWFKVDYTGRYLAALEDIAINEVEAAGEPMDYSEASLTRVIAAYFGETLIRLAGGTWVWLEDEPAVRADDALNLAPVFPLRLKDRLLDQGGHPFVETYAEWEQAVATYRQAHPGWEPTKAYSPRLESPPLSTDEQAYIESWVAQREAGFEAWATEYAADGPWDFTVESLDRLEDLLHRVTPTGDDLKDPTNAGFVEGAVWYFGESLRRIRGGTWIYREPDPERHDMYVGLPYVVQADRDSRKSIPILALQRVVLDGQRDALRRKYSAWTR